MKLRFRHQPFQADAANAVCDVFAGQLPHSDVDRGSLFLDNTFFEQPQEMFMLKNI